MLLLTCTETEKVLKIFLLYLHDQVCWFGWRSTSRRIHEEGKNLSSSPPILSYIFRVVSVQLKADDQQTIRLI